MAITAYDLWPLERFTHWWHFRFARGRGKLQKPVNDTCKGETLSSASLPFRITGVCLPLVFLLLADGTLQDEILTSSRSVTRRTCFRCSDVQAGWVNWGGIHAEEMAPPSHAPAAVSRHRLPPPLNPSLPHPPLSYHTPTATSVAVGVWTYVWRSICLTASNALLQRVKNNQQPLDTLLSFFFCPMPGRPRRNSGAPSVFSVNKTCWKNKIPSSGVLPQYAPMFLSTSMVFTNHTHWQLHRQKNIVQTWKVCVFFCFSTQTIGKGNHI